jgi:glycosyltransferase involved in cell wall biosynthesis
VKVAYVVPRYGLEVVGGAEYAARMFAERVAARPGWEVEALTTCAMDSNTWAPEYAPGTVELNGVRVHRFPQEAGRSADFPAIQARALQVPTHASTDDQQHFITSQGPVSTALLDGIRSSDADLLIFYPYLFWPTVHGVPLAAGRAVMHPAAHDEAPVRLPLFTPVFEGVDGLVFQTISERDFVHSRFKVGHVPQVLLGLGCEEGPGEPQDARDAFGIGDRPYLLYVGRVDNAKGCTLLANYFIEYKRRHPGPLALVLAGQVVEPPPEHDDIVLPGMVHDEIKWGALRGAAALVSPSAFEAFSIILVEGWTAGVPVLVNGRCHPTREHCERSGGGLWYESYATFEVAVDHLVHDEPMRHALAERGAAYVEANFRWPGLIDRYTSFLGRVADRRRRAAATAAA